MHTDRGFEGSRVQGSKGLRARSRARTLEPSNPRTLRGCLAVLAILAAWASPSAAVDRLPVGELRQNLFASCFVSDQEGFMVSDLARIFHTTDAGKTWQYTEAP